MDAEKNLSHPDANLLAAFTEDLLTASERRSVMEHLAACLRCREVIFLEQGVTPESAPRMSAEQKPSLWGRLNLSRPAPSALWASAVAALIVAVAIPLLVTYRWQQWTHPASQIASKEANGPTREVFSGAQRANAPAPAAAAPARKAGSAKGGAGGSHQPHRTGGHSTQGFSRRAFEERSENFGVGRGMSSVSRSEGDVAHSVAAPAFSLPQPEATGNAQSAGAPAAPTVAAPVEPLLQERSAGREEKSAVSAEVNFRVTAGIITRCQGESCTPLSLPGATSADSIAFFGKTVLALDTDGNLFVSDDQGDHWTRVPNQWTGQAHSLKQIGPELSSDAAARNYAGKTLSAGARSSLAYSADAKKDSASPVFALIDGNGQTWLSFNGGMTWISKKAP